VDLILRFTRRFALPLWPWYLSGIIALALTNLIALEIPQLAKRIVNALGNPQRPDDLQSTALLIVQFGILTIVIRAMSRILIFYPGRKLEATSKSYYFNRMMTLPQSFYDKFGMGELISRLANDIGQLRALFAFGMLQFLNLIFLITMTISKMAEVHLSLTLLCLSPLLLMVVLMKYMMGTMHRVSMENQKAIGRLTNRVTEAFVNIHVIKANAVENTFLERSQQENIGVYKTNINSVLLRTILFPLMGSFMNISQVIVILYGGREVMAGRLSIGDILAFNVYIAYLAFPLSAFGILISLYQRSKASLERVNKIETHPSEIESTTKTNFHIESKDVLNITNLDFSYPSEAKDPPTFLNNINLQVPPGKHVGVFGPVGCGKSTLFRLITKIIDPPEKAIFLEGKDIKSILPNQLRQDICFATQSVHLFSASIKENLSYGLTGITQNQLESAASAASILEEVQKFPNGWDTEIGERGVRLSGGQKQRLALARIFLRRPKLLLLDDVLSAVDHQTESQLLKYISSTNTSTVIASHRISALQHCDEVLLMDRGKIIDRGLLAELITRHSSFMAETEVSGDEL